MLFLDKRVIGHKKMFLLEFKGTLFYELLEPGQTVTEQYCCEQ